MELTILWCRGAGLVSFVPCLHEVRKNRFLPWPGVATGPARHEQGQEHAIPRYLRRRQTRGETVGHLGQAGRGVTGLACIVALANGTKSTASSASGSWRLLVLRRARLS